MGSAITAAWPRLRPLPPSGSGTAMPSQPSSAICAQTLASKPASVLIKWRTADAGDRSRQKLVADSSSMACSSLKWTRVSSGRILI